jgi:hypothetical protein
MSDNILNMYKDYANIDEYIYPKDIPGYVTPERQKVVADNQEIRFVYKPIEYPIIYDLGGGIIPNNLKQTFTIKDEYEPPIPEREMYVFDKWIPSRIEKGTIGAVKFTAFWLQSPVLMDGEDLRNVLIELCGEENIGKIKAIQFSDDLPKNNSVHYVNVSKTESPIYVWYASDADAFVFCADFDIVCDDMVGVFKDFVSLRDIAFFSNTVPANEVDVESMFENCNMLSNTAPIEHWSTAEFTNIDNAFAGTMAVETNTCPSWYKYKVKVNIVSTTGKTIDDFTAYVTPSQRLYIKFYKGYAIPANTIMDKNKSVEITGDCEISVELEPIQFAIRYAYTSGIFKPEKTKYTIEDPDFVPHPVLNNKPEFIGWTPSVIPSGSIGDVLFIANYKNGD